MLTSQRKALILDRLRQTGRAVAKEIAMELALSEDTIRRDMRDMAAAGLLQRVHGGALPLSPELPDFTARKSRATAEKQALAAQAVTLVEAGQTLFLDGGTTNAEIARRLPAGTGLTVITHSPTIACELENRRDIDVILLGGRLYRHSMVAMGTETAAAIGRLRPDLFFLGATALHPQAGASTGDHEEAAIKRMIASVSRRTCLCVTAEKLDRVSPHIILPVDAIALAILPEDIGEARRKPYEAAGLIA
ncbi:DeoR/GlpR family DNA-binding transcription regulator [Rhizobium paknamense]|uniref:DeoR/GlpR family transcriptional regulator of sugar metabolism n=1 Tax=Rhizobium paknamense TaxID=1206817 RepID=A0ABU0IAD1_9HYPH|nr:DeoR/GlpR family DNA-binding transcription regulator [Rhizobium paknamense]MDQ0455192.1 DeoR/GlpR family transcriptional regulator of sugar metabolism [Rhizobium paknamense]